MNIGEAAAASGVSAKMIRYYEQAGLIAADRSEANYRRFTSREVAELRFIRRARGLGFPLEEIARLLALWRDRERPSREVKAIAERRLAEMEARIAEMQAMAADLRRLARACAGDEHPHCAILEGLETPETLV
jgi:Cu(I)-responsive transcriptional regulator